MNRLVDALKAVEAMNEPTLRACKEAAVATTMKKLLEREDSLKSALRLAVDECNHDKLQELMNEVVELNMEHDISEVKQAMELQARVKSIKARLMDGEISGLESVMAEARRLKLGGCGLLGCFLRPVVCFWFDDM